MMADPDKPPALAPKGTVATLSLLAVASMVSGYFRELCLASILGAGRQADSYLAIMMIVRLACDIGPAAILSASVIPALSPLLGRPFAVRSHLLGLLLAATLAMSGFLVLGLHLAMPTLLAVLVPGFDGDARGMSQEMAWGLVWFIPLQSACVLLTLFLNAHGKFLAAAAAPVVSNAIFVLVLLVGRDSAPIPLMWSATLAGPGVSMILLGLAVRSLGTFGLAAQSETGKALRSLWTIAWPVLISMGLAGSTGLLMLCQLLLRREGSFAGEGAVAALAYAFRLYEIPVSLTANITATLALPSLSRLYANGSSDRLAEICRNIAEWGLLMLVPAAVLTAMEAPVLVDTLLAYGRFSAADAERTAAALTGFAPAILFEAGIVVFYRALYALHRPKWALSVSVAVLSSLVLIISAMPDPTIIGLALAFSCSMGAGLVLLMALLYRHLGGAILPFRGNGPALAGLLAISALAFVPLNYSPVLGGLIFVLAYVGGAFTLLPRHRAALLGLLRRRETPP